jgi:hypothetical protein
VEWYPEPAKEVASADYGLSYKSNALLRPSKLPIQSPRQSTLE